MAQITSLVMEKVQSNRFPIIVYGSFLLPWQPNQEADRQTFGYFELSYAKQHLYQIRVLLLPWFWFNAIKSFSHYKSMGGRSPQFWLF